MPYVDSGDKIRYNNIQNVVLCIILRNHGREGVNVSQGKVKREKKQYGLGILVGILFFIIFLYFAVCGYMGNQIGEMPNLFGYSIYIAQPDSLNAPEGSAIWTNRNAKEIEPGKAIVFYDPDIEGTNKMAMQYVYERTEGGYLTYETEDADLTEVSDSQVRGAAESAIPVLGWVLSFAQTSIGIVVFSLISYGIFGLVLFAVIKRAHAKKRPPEYLELDGEADEPYTLAVDDDESTTIMLDKKSNRSNDADPAQSELSAAPKELKETDFCRKAEKEGEKQAAKQKPTSSVYTAVLEPQGIVQPKNEKAEPFAFAMQVDGKPAAKVDGRLAEDVVETTMTGTEQEIALLAKLIRMAIQSKNLKNFQMKEESGEPSRLHIVCEWGDLTVVSKIIAEMKRRFGSFQGK